MGTEYTAEGTVVEQVWDGNHNVLRIQIQLPSRNFGKGDRVKVTVEKA